MASLTKLLTKFKAKRKLLLSNWPSLMLTDVCNQTNTHGSGPRLKINCVIGVLIFDFNKAN